MRQAEALLLLVSGGRQYAVAHRQVRVLARWAETQPAQTLAHLLNAVPLDDERCAISVAGLAEQQVVLVEQADLSSTLPQFALPVWLARQAHPAVIGLVVVGECLVPLIDLTRLALETGYNAS